MRYRFIYVSILTVILASCATFYELNYEFNRSFEDGNIESAKESLYQNRSAIKKKAKFLYLANYGVVHNLLGDYESSNKYFEKAYIYGEDYQKNYLASAASFLTNPNTVDYPGEDHEHLLLLYYKAMNYLRMDDYESALVECRRLNNRLYELSDKYRSERKWQQDAFIHNLMGLIYDANGDYNNAFIAYRNALDIYETDYTEFFSLGPPEQLKKDLMRTAYLSGFSNEVDFYEQKFETSYEHQPNINGDVIFFWQNGLGPIKDEWSINFTTLEDQGGVVFVNDELGFSFPFSTASSSDKTSITDLELFRVTMPKYVERTPKFHGAVLRTEDGEVEMELTEDINAIAFKSLQQRLVLELGKSLMRAALKKALEETIEKENEGLGLIVGIVNAATEKADTRNWQTIPHSIYYSRIPLKEGDNQIRLLARGSNLSTELETFSFQGQKGKTIFHAYQTLY